MDIKVYSTVPDRKEAIYLAAKFFANELKLQKSKYQVHIVCKKSMRKQGMIGLAAKTEDKKVFVFIDNRLSTEKFLLTLAHEMVHVKQMAKGQYKFEHTRSGNVKQYWMGKHVKKVYYNRPWEIEAYIREVDLVAKLLTKIQIDSK